MISSTVLLKEKWKRGRPEGNGKINLFNRCVGHVNRTSNRGLSIMLSNVSFGQWRVYKFFFFLMWKKKMFLTYRWVYQIKAIKKKMIKHLNIVTRENWKKIRYLWKEIYNLNDKMFTQEKNIYIYIIRSSDKRILRKEKKKIMISFNFVRILFQSTSIYLSQFSRY